jgi:prepilin-type N-terminal cleavage/methylation domain-containing protein
MKGGKTPLGYTIIEVMVVLAVSGVMFLIAANFVNGKQERTAFTEGINETASRIQDVIEQVTDGQYSDILQTCSFTGGITNILPAGGSHNQGTSTQCVFLGKLISFTYPSTHGYEVFSLAGGRVDAPIDGSPINLTSVDPAIVPSLTTTQATQQQLDVVKVTIVDSVTGTTHTSGPITPSATPGAGTYNIGFVEGLGTVNGTGSFQSGAQTISMVYSSLSPTPLSGATNGIGLSVAKSATICLTDGKQSANLILGTNNNQLNTDIQRLSPGVGC